MKTKILRALLKSGDVNGVVDELIKVVDGLPKEALRGEKGEKGDRGEQGVGRSGRDGKNGRDGKDGIDGVAPSVEEIVDEIKPEVIRRLVRPHGGGNANRDIKVEGKTVLTPYTDINFTGTQSSIATAVDTVNNRINILLPDATAGFGAYRAATASTSVLSGDFTVDCSGTFVVSLPTAVGVQGKIYNIKNSDRS